MIVFFLVLAGTRLPGGYNTRDVAEREGRALFGAGNWWVVEVRT